MPEAGEQAQRVPGARNEGVGPAPEIKGKLEVGQGQRKKDPAQANWGKSVLGRGSSDRACKRSGNPVASFPKATTYSVPS